MFMLPPPQARGTVSRLDVYGQADSLPGCGAPGDLLSWEDMAWSLQGAATTGSVPAREVCLRESTVLVMTAVFPEWEECMQGCGRLGGNRAAGARSREEGERLLAEVGWILTDPGTGGPWHGIPGTCISDKPLGEVCDCMSMQAGEFGWL